jgi:hypothetical protein
LLADRKRIHVGAQCKTFCAASLAQNADDARATKSLRNLITVSSQAFGNQRTGALLLEGKFRMPVQITPQGDELA